MSAALFQLAADVFSNVPLSVLCFLEFATLVIVVTAVCTECPCFQRTPYRNCIQQIEKLRTPVTSRSASREEEKGGLETVYEQF